MRDLWHFFWQIVDFFVPLPKFLSHQLTLINNLKWTN